MKSLRLVAASSKHLQHALWKRIDEYYTESECN